MLDFDWEKIKETGNEVVDNLKIIPSDMTQNEITVPKTPNSNIVLKFLKNCFFLTWNLKRKCEI